MEGRLRRYPVEMMRAAEGDERGVVANYSIGLALKGDGGVIDTIEGMVAAKAGIGPGMKVIAVNRRQFSPEVLRDALKAAEQERTVGIAGRKHRVLQTYKLDYQGGEKYPHLVRDETKPDLLSEIYKAK